MKKNWMLRLGLLAMVLTLVTMPMVSSTYAKYVTAASGTDTARVAKWGLTITAGGSGASNTAFNVSYSPNEVDPDSSTVALAVNADTSGTIDDVLAPGTTGNFTFTISGTPEVATRLTFDASSTLSADWFVLTKNYQPVNWSISKTVSGTTSYWTGSAWDTTLANKEYFTIADLDTELNTISDEYEPLTAFAGTTVYTITWEWPFEFSTGYVEWADMETAVAAAIGGTPTDVQIYDYADTALGMLGTAPQMAVTINITATQIN